MLLSDLNMTKQEALSTPLADAEALLKAWGEVQYERNTPEDEKKKERVSVISEAQLIKMLQKRNEELENG